MISDYNTSTVRIVQFATFPIRAVVKDWYVLIARVLMSKNMLA